MRKVKLIILIIVTSLVFFLTIRGAVAVVFPPVKGDVNGDGVITITDYTLIRLHILGLEELK